MLSDEAIVGKMERRIVAQMMDIVILSILNHDGGEISGYDFIKFLHRKFRLLINPGTVYSQFHTMERQGLLKGRQKQGKRIYSLTNQRKEKAQILVRAERKIINFIKGLFRSRSL